MTSAVLAALTIAACGGHGGGGSSSSPPITPTPPPIIGPDTPEVFVGAGDIGWCGPDGGALRTGALLDRIPGTVFAVGDGAYMQGTYQQFLDCYDPGWGRHRSRTRPVPGNHEYMTPGAAGYFQYFGAAAVPPSGYYSFPLGAWRVYALNSEISAFPGSAQLEWLRSELAANPTTCALAYFHTPLFGSGTNGGNPQMLAAWRVMYDMGVDVIVNGHNHGYERFAPQDPDGRHDQTRGIREFVAGTGGAPLTGFPRAQPNSDARISAWGVLKLTLYASRYEWEFVPESTGPTDVGSASCH